MTTTCPLPYYWIHYNNLIDKVIIDNSLQHFSDVRDKIKNIFIFNFPPQLIKLYYCSNQENKNINSMLYIDPQNLIRSDGVLKYGSGSNFFIQIDNPIIGQVNIFKNDSIDQTPQNLKPDYVFDAGITWNEIANYLHLPKGVAIKRRNTPNNYFVKQPFQAGDYVLIKTNIEKKVYLKIRSKIKKIINK